MDYIFFYNFFIEYKNGAIHRTLFMKGCLPSSNMFSLFFIFFFQTTFGCVMSYRCLRFRNSYRCLLGR